MVVDKKNRIRITVLGLLGIVMLMLGLFVAQHLHKPTKHALLQGTVLESPKVLPSFEMMGIDHQPVDEAHLKGHWTFVLFGFTSCSTICPTNMAVLAKMMHLLEAKGVSPLPQVMFVSIDPARDSLEKLDAYVKAFHARFYAARAEEGSLQTLTQSLGIAYAKDTSTAQTTVAGDSIEHAGTILLLNPQAQMQVIFTSPHDAAKLAEDYQRMIV